MWMPEYRGRTYVPKDKLPNGAKLWTRKESAKRSVVPAKTHELAYPAGYWGSSDQLPEDQKVGFRAGDLVWWVGPVRQAAALKQLGGGIAGYTAVPFLVVKSDFNGYSPGYISHRKGTHCRFLGPNGIELNYCYPHFSKYATNYRQPDLYFEKKKHPVWCDEGLKVIGWEFAE